MKFWLLLSLLLLNRGVYAQVYSDKEIDSIVRAFPENLKSFYQVADLIESNFSDQRSKARAAYTWVARNIEYDVKLYLSDKDRKNFSDEKIVKRTFKKKLGVCEGYALLYEAIAEEVGLYCKTIVGDAKVNKHRIGRSSFAKRDAHAWNAVNIDGNWMFLDATWGAGYFIGDNYVWIADYDDVYFLTDKDKFFLHHFPYDTSWLLYDASKEQYLNLPYYHRDYLSSDYEIIEPKNGIVKSQTDSIIEFVMKNPPSNISLYYKFSYQKDLKELPYKTDSLGLLRANIPCELGRDGYLHIARFLNGIVTYKVDVIK